MTMALSLCCSVVATRCVFAKQTRHRSDCQLFTVPLQGFLAFLRGLHGTGIQMLMTSRCRVSVDLQEAQHLRISSLQPADAAVLLQRRYDCHR